MAALVYGVASTFDGPTTSTAQRGSLAVVDEVMSECWRLFPGLARGCACCALLGRRLRHDHERLADITVRAAARHVSQLRLGATCGFKATA